MDESVDIPTSIIVGKDGLNKNFEITDGSILDRCETLLKQCESELDGIDLNKVSCIKDLLDALNG